MQNAASGMPKQTAVIFQKCQQSAVIFQKCQQTAVTFQKCQQSAVAFQKCQQTAVNFWHVKLQMGSCRMMRMVKMSSTLTLPSLAS